MARRGGKFDMNGADLRESLISTMLHLLDYEENIKQQMAEAKKVIIVSLEQRKDMQPISIEKDAIWFNYLVESLNGVKLDILLVSKALSQLGVSLPNFFGSNDEFNSEHEKNQGIDSLDFSVSRER